MDDLFGDADDISSDSGDDAARDDGREDGEERQVRSGQNIGATFISSYWLLLYTGELGYDGPLYGGFLHMTDDMLGPSPMHIKYSSYVYDRFCI